LFFPGQTLTPNNGTNRAVSSFFLIRIAKQAATFFIHNKNKMNNRMNCVSLTVSCISSSSIVTLLSFEVFCHFPGLRCIEFTELLFFLLVNIYCRLSSLEISSFSVHTLCPHILSTHCVHTLCPHIVSLALVSY
jgi:hypothetical protein